MGRWLHAWSLHSDHLKSPADVGAEIHKKFKTWFSRVYKVCASITETVCYHYRVFNELVNSFELLAVILHGCSKIAHNT